MQIPVLIERLSAGSYCARGGEPLGLTADGASQEEALAKLKENFEDRLRNGAVVVSLEVATSSPFPGAADGQRGDYRALRGGKIGRSDLRIAATVLEYGATLVTENVRDFKQVPG